MNDRHLLRSSSTIAVGTGLSRLTGMIRVVVLAIALGGGPLADAYNLANVSPNIIYELLLGGVLSATLVPLFVDSFEHGDEDGPSAIFSVSMIGLVAITIAAIVGAPLLAHIYGAQLRGTDRSDQYALVIPFLRLILPEILFYGITALATAALNARRRFVAAAFAPVLNNVVVIGVFIYVAIRYNEVVTVTANGHPVIANGHVVHIVRSTAADSTTGQLIVGLGTTAGIAVMTMVLVPAMRRAGIRLTWFPRWRHPAVVKMARLSGWTLGYVAANQIALFVVLALADSTRGNVTAYQNAYIYFQLPHGLIAVSIMTAFLPELAAAASRHDSERFRTQLMTGFRFVLIGIVPAAVGYVVLGGPVATLFLRHGSYTAAQAALAGRTLSSFAWGLPGFSLYLFALQGFYARKDTRTPFLLNLGENGLNIVFALVVAGGGAPALAKAYSLAYTVAGVVALIVLGRRIGGFGGTAMRDLVTQAARVLVAAVSMGLTVWLSTVAFESTSPVRLLVGVPVGLAVYAGVGTVIGVDGLDRARNALTSRLGRSRS